MELFLSNIKYWHFRIDYKNKQSEFVYKKCKKLNKNPQDIYHNEKDNELAIVRDFDYGLISIKQWRYSANTDYQMTCTNSLNLSIILEINLYHFLGF